MMHRDYFLPLQCISSTVSGNWSTIGRLNSAKKKVTNHSKKSKIGRGKEKLSRRRIKSSSVCLHRALPVSGQWDFPKGWSVTGPCLSQLETKRQQTRRKGFQLCARKSSQRYCKRRWWWRRTIFVFPPIKRAQLSLKACKVSSCWRAIHAKQRLDKAEINIDRSELCHRLAHFSTTKVTN